MKPMVWREINDDIDIYIYIRGFQGGSVVKNPPPNAGDLGSIPVSGTSMKR